MGIKSTPKIERGLNLPAPAMRGRPFVYPIDQMKPPVNGKYDSIVLNAATSIARLKRRFPDRDFTIRKEGGKYRLFRTA